MACLGVSLGGGGADVERGKREVNGGRRCGRGKREQVEEKPLRWNEVGGIGRVNLLERRPKVLRLSRQASERRGERSKGGKRG